MKITKSLLSLLLIGLFISSCGDPDPKDVNIKFQMKVGDEALVHDNTYSINGVDVKFTNVAFYLGDMTFETSDNQTYKSSDAYYLIRPGAYDFNFTLPEETEDAVSLSSVSFFIGVDAETNAESEMDFTERAEGDPLGQQNPSMHWGWAGGYKFFNIDGVADIDGDGEFETTLTYHLGRNEFLKDVTITPNIVIEEGLNSFDIEFDVAAWLGVLDLETENFTKVQPDNRALAEKLFDNYGAAIKFIN